MYKNLLLVLLTALCLPAANATVMRLDFAGTIVGTFPLGISQPLGQYSGTLLIDTSVEDTDAFAGRGFYAQALLGGSIDWNGSVFDVPAGDAVIIRNNSSVFNDLFALVFLAPGGAATPSLFGFQLGDSSQTIFSDDSLPTELNLTDFDPLEIDNIDGTGVFAVVNSTIYQSTIDTLSYVPVPLPGALFLLCSGLVTLGFRSRRRPHVY